MKKRMRTLGKKARRAWDQQEVELERSLGDFTTTYRVIPLSLAAVAIGVAALPRGAKVEIDAVVAVPA